MIKFKEYKSHKVHSIRLLNPFRCFALGVITSLALLSANCSNSGGKASNTSGEPSEPSEKEFSARLKKPSLCQAPEISGMTNGNETMTEEALVELNGNGGGDITTMTTMSQLTDTVGYCQVETTRSLRIFTPKYNRISLHVGPSNPQQLPNRSLVFPAAYTKGGGEPMIEQIVGDFVTNDSLFKGVEDPFITGYFVFNGDTAEFGFISANDADRLSEVAGHHGTAFGQDMVIHECFIIKTVREQVGKDRVDRYRVLCHLGGQLRVVESKEKIKFQDFQQLLIDLGVKDAIYLDMGSYNYGWYQGDEGFQDLPDVYDFKDNKYSNFLMFEM